MKTIQFITHYTEKYSYLDSARIALKGGCRWIQLRMKDAGKEEIVSIAMELRDLCNDCDAIFTIDDRVELVRRVEADGVHLGKNDMSVAEARRILGDKYIVDGIANTCEDVKRHWLNRVNYIGCGPFRYITTKQKFSPILRLEGYKEIIQKMQEEKIRHPPVITISGITSTGVPAIMQTGVTSTALSGTALRADNPVEEMWKILVVISQTNSY